MAFVDHPLRARVVSEMHMRRMPSLSAPTLMIQVVRLVDPAEREQERAQAKKMPGVAGHNVLERKRHIGAHRGDGVEFLWERHSEATTATVILPDRADNPLEPQPSDAAGLDWLSDLPGGVIRAVQIIIVSDEATAAALVSQLDFSPADLVSCMLGNARIWSDFLVRGDNFGRLLISASDVTPTDLGRLVQQIQEMGNYRNLALLGLPMAQQEAPAVAELEAQLVDITSRMANGQADSALLDELCDLAARVQSIIARTAYRMSATAAYAQIVHDRLTALAATSLPGFQTLEEFNDRRFLPAMRTCASFSMRLEALSVQIERATALLRTRVEMTLQTQNSALLHSMDDNAARQLRLQHVVEGLSVVAVSYYAVGLVGYVVKAAAPRFGIAYELAIGVSVLPVMLLVGLYLRWRVRHVTHP
jgi:uncharacterized membrane-anchored protein